jgi:hypothetical protein
MVFAVQEGVRAKPPHTSDGAHAPRRAHGPPQRAGTPAEATRTPQLPTTPSQPLARPHCPDSPLSTRHLNQQPTRSNTPPTCDKARLMPSACRISEACENNLTHRIQIITIVLGHRRPRTHRTPVRRHGPRRPPRYPVLKYRYAFPYAFCIKYMLQVRSCVNWSARSRQS